MPYIALAVAEPAARGDFLLGEKLHAFLALHMQVTEERIVPTVERKPRHRSRHADVDADHAALDGISQQERAPSVLREAIRRQPKGESIGLFDRLVKGLERAHQSNRSKRLLIHHARLERHIGQHRGPEEEAIVMGASAAFSTDGDTRTDFQRIVDESRDGFGASLPAAGLKGPADTRFCAGEESRSLEMRST